MELICGQLLQKDLWSKWAMLKNASWKLEILTIKGDFRKFKKGCRLKEIQKRKAKKERIEIIII